MDKVKVALCRFEFEILVEMVNVALLGDPVKLLKSPMAVTQLEGIRSMAKRAIEAFELAHAVDQDRLFLADKEGLLRKKLAELELIG